MSSDLPLVTGPNATPIAQRRRFRGRRWLWVALIAAGVAALSPIGLRIGAAIARRRAVGQLDAGELAAARRSLVWAARLASDNGDTDLLEAACDRHARQMHRWRQRLQSAGNHGAELQLLERERKLGEIQMGVFAQAVETEVGNLVDAGTPPQEIITAVFFGYLARNDVVLAKVFLERLPEFHPDPLYGRYLWAIYRRRTGELPSAETLLKEVLNAQPANELARAELAEVFEEQGHLDRALAEYVDLARRSRGGETAKLGLARVLRKSGRFEESRDQLAPLARSIEPSAEVRVEMAQCELGAGNYEEAQARFAELPMEQIADLSILSGTAVTLALRGKSLDAERLFARITQLGSRGYWLMDLQARQANAPQDQTAIEALRRLAQPPASDAVATPAKTAAGTTAELYREHCEACHGPNGDGRGRAGRNLFPRPRNLRTGKSQIVRTRNGVPTLEDIEQVLALGMGGTSMKAFDKLSPEQRRRLAEEVVRFRREGVREQLRRSMAAEGETVDEAELRAAVENCTTPGESVRVPDPWPATADAHRGKEAYVALGCNKCHGGNGQGAADQPLFDDQGEPNRPRDLVWEPFKGGRDPQSLYLRIVAGMPGSAHPAASNLPEPQLIDVVQYTRSLARQPERKLTNFQRRQEDTLQAYLAAHAAPRLAPSEPPPENQKPPKNQQPPE